jgi:hypothetical protein
MMLTTIAHGRSGDKGNKANVSLIAFDETDYPFLEFHVTEEYVADVFADFIADPGPQSVDRYTIPSIRAMNFVLHDALGGGASESLRIDTQGKTFATLLLRQDIAEEYRAYKAGQSE